MRKEKHGNLAQILLHTFCSHSYLSEVWKIAKRFRESNRGTQSVTDPNEWISEFADKIAPPFVSNNFTLPECSGRFIWLANPFTLNELNTALNFCKNTAAGLDGVKFLMLKRLPDNALRFLMDFFNVFSTGKIPECWREIKLVAFLKNSNNSDSYRPISLLSYLRKLLEKKVCSRLVYCGQKDSKYTHQRNMRSG
jgi:hypothetical protein